MSKLVLILDGNCVDIILDDVIREDLNVLHQWDLEGLAYETIDRIFNVAMNLEQKIFSNKDQTLYENIEEFDSELCRIISALKNK